MRILTDEEICKPCGEYKAMCKAQKCDWEKHLKKINSEQVSAIRSDTEKLIEAVSEALYQYFQRHPEEWLE
jgi:hypothetical protein